METVLWQRWRTRRDRRALGRVLQRHLPFAYDFARRVTGRTADAEDVAQQALLELTEAPPELPERVGVRAFLGRRIVLNARTLRRAALTRARIEPRARTAAAPPHASSIERRDQITAALALLATEDRDAVVLRYLHELSYREIAHTLGIREEAARMRVHRALKRLRRHYGQRASHALGGLALFAAPRQLLGSTVRVAAFGKGVLLMSAPVRYSLLLLPLLLVSALSFHLWHRPQKQPGAHRAERTGVALTPTDAAAPPRLAATTAAEKKADKSRSQTDTAALRGRIQTPDGRAPERVAIALNGSSTTVDVGPDGTFFLDDLPPGDHRVSLHLGRGHRVALASFTARENSPRERLFTVAPGHPVTGRVTAADPHHGIAEAQVLFSRVGGHNKTAQASWASALTDANGRFELRFLVAGTYDVTVISSTFHPSGYASVRKRVEVGDDTAPLAFVAPRTALQYVKLRRIPPALLGKPALLTVAGKTGRLIEVDALAEGQYIEFERPEAGAATLQLARTASHAPLANRDVTFDVQTPSVIELTLLEGHVLRGMLRDETGKPFAARELQLEPNYGTAHTNADGSFAFPFVPTAALAVFLRSGTGRVRIGMTPAEGTLELRVPGQAQLSGTVLREHEPSQVRVLVQTRAGTAATAEINEQGEFRVGALAAAAYVVTVTARGAPAVTRVVRVAARAETSAGVFDLRRVMPVPLVVRVPAKATMPASITVHAEDGSRTESVALDAQGRGLLRRFTLGAWGVELRAPGFATARAKWHLSSGAPPVVIELRRP